MNLFDKIALLIIVLSLVITKIFLIFFGVDSEVLDGMIASIAVVELFTIFEMREK